MLIMMVSWFNKVAIVHFVHEHRLKKGTVFYAWTTTMQRLKESPVLSGVFYAAVTTTRYTNLAILLPGWKWPLRICEVNHA